MSPSADQRVAEFYAQTYDGQYRIGPASSISIGVLRWKQSAMKKACSTLHAEQGGLPSG